MPSSKDKTIFTVLLLIAGCAGFIQEMTLYHGLDCTGAGMIFQTKETNLQNFNFFLPGVQSYKARGWWWFFSGTGFSPYITHSSYRSVPTCFNSTTPRRASSLRFAGPLESDTPALAVYDLDSASGAEIVFTTGAAHNFGFVADYAIASGTSSWTLYFTADFTGNSTCVHAGGGLVYKSATFRSAIMGCNKENESNNVTVIGNEPRFFQA